MTQKNLLMLFAVSFTLAANAQKKSERTTAYVITSAEKSSSKWTEVKLVDMITGEEIQSVYQSKSEVPLLNARTKKPVLKKDIVSEYSAGKGMVVLTQAKLKQEKEIRNYQNATVTITSPVENIQERKLMHRVSVVIPDAPFATNSAACAYDKKHDRLYYTPMGINQLRYIDLKTETPTIYYFEDEPLGVLSSPGDISNQITRMTIGSNGDGYALTNNAEHLIQFTTNKKATITDLGALTDDVSNGNYSIHNGGGYGGDMVADDSKDLYLVTANRMVFKIDIKTRVATYKGSIKGLPAGFTTNGAAVEKGTSIIVCSSTNSSTYYKFNLDNMQAEKIASGGSVFNASDLANGNLVSEKKKKKEAEEKPVEEKKDAENKNAETAKADKTIPQESMSPQKMALYPNPVSNGLVKISFENYQAGEYELQLMDLSGKILSTESAAINSKIQTLDYKLPLSIAKGTYLLKVVNNTNKVLNTEKIIVQ
ncbi:MAG: T9SS type A sorting domain-containing protein [Ferruginibacter sp.]